MPWKIFDDKTAKRTFEKALPPPEKDIALVAVNYKRSNVYAKRADNEGLEDALREAEHGTPVILMSFLLEKELMKDFRFVVLINLGNVSFVEEPMTLDEVLKSAKDVAAARHIPDPLGFALAREKNTSAKVPVLRHDLRYAKQDPKRMSGWLQEARAHGFTGNDAEIIAAVEAWKENTPRKFAGRFFPGLFVDIGGTLLNSKGEINPSVLGTADLASRERPVTLWTGGDITALEQLLRRNGVRWKVVSKHLLEGAIVEEAIDDLPQDVFEKEYGITVQKYHHYCV